MSMIINPFAAGTFVYPALPAVPQPANLRYRFDASYGVWADAGKTIPCAAGGPVRLWENDGLATDDGTQATLARRPILRTGGVNGLPYLECRAVNQQFFDNLIEGSQPSGFTSSAPYTVVAVLKQTSLTNSALFGEVNGGFKARVDLVNNGGALAFRHYKTQVFHNLTDQTGGLNIFAAVKRSGAGNFGRGLNNLNYTTRVQNTNSSSSGNTGMGFLKVGTNSIPADFDLYEVFYYNTDIGATNTNLLLNQLRTKYGLPTV